MSGQSSNPLALIAAQQQAAREAAAAKPISYVPASERDETLAHTVHKIYATCHEVNATSGNGQTNHWTLSFDVGDGKSVGMDVQPNPQQSHTTGGDKACVILSSLDYLITTTLARADPVSVTHERSVGWYIDYLASAKRFQYAFAPDGVGCRQWVTDTLQLFEDAGELDKKEAEIARSAILYLSPGGTYSAPVGGTYFG